MAKIVDIPAAVELESPLGKDPYSWADFSLEALHQYSKLNQGEESAHFKRKMRNKLEGLADDAKAITLEDDEFNKLRDAVKTAKYNPRYMELFVEFFESFHDDKVQSVELPGKKEAKP